MTAQRQSVASRLCNCLGLHRGGPSLIGLLLRYCHTCDAITWRGHSAEHLDEEQCEFMAELDAAYQRARAGEAGDS